MTDPAGKLIVVSGPSGAGKSTVLERLLASCPVPLVMSVSATTRAPRPGEVHGKHYYFLSRQEFEARRQRGEFLESCEVYGRGDWYGTLSSEVTTSLREGKWVVLEIDVEGTFNVLAQYPEAVTIFITPRDIDELERRLRRRGTESEEALTRRLEVARREMAQAHEYRHRVVNDEIDQAVEDVCTILKNAECGIQNAE